MCTSFKVAVHLALLLYKTMTSHWAFCQGRGRAQAAALRSRLCGAHVPQPLSRRGGGAKAMKAMKAGKKSRRPRFRGGHAALTKVVKSFAKKQSFIRYGEKGRRSPLQRQKMIALAPLIKGIVKLQENGAFRDADWKAAVDDVWQANHKKWNMKEGQKHGYTKKITARLKTLGVHIGLATQRRSKWFDVIKRETKNDDTGDDDGNKDDNKKDDVNE